MSRLPNDLAPRLEGADEAGRLGFAAPAEQEACTGLVQMALAEDLGPKREDLTSAATIPADLQGQAALVARAAGVIAGLPAARVVLQKVDPQLEFDALAADGSRVEAGTRLALVRGPLRSLLAAERTALNFLQRLSGVATLTRKYVDAVAGLPVRILDTRKTTPGWRLLEKYAVRKGGGHNHRLGLHDGILIKDNHLAALRAAKSRAPIAQAILAVRSKHPNLPVEIEVDNLEELAAALAQRPDIILLDNMDVATLREAVRCRNDREPSVQLEASGGVTLATVRATAETGVDRISIGALTHSAPALDIALDYLAK